MIPNKLLFPLERVLCKFKYWYFNLAVYVYMPNLKRSYSKCSFRSFVCASSQLLFSTAKILELLNFFQPLAIISS